MLPSLSVKALFRVWLPVVLCATGVVLLLVKGFNGFGVGGFAGFVGAGSSVWLTNYLWRMGVDGEDERDREEDARRYFAAHGHWPDQPSRDPPR